MYFSRQPMSDVLVVIPGIAGSVLESSGKEIWGISGQAIFGNLLSLGRNVKQLNLPKDIGDNEPNDGIRATRLMPDLHLLPGLWTIDGYNRLIKFLKDRFIVSEPTEQTPGNLVLFPYDWRLSNVISAKQLSHVADRALDRWRKHTSNQDAKLVLICHSMGGLVARWFLEVLGGKELTRQLITIGTPYQGSINSLDKLVNGFSPGLGPLHINLTEFVRSLPSMYQLLPTYDCLDIGGGMLHKLTEVTLPEIKSSLIQEAADFHVTIAREVEQVQAGYDISAIKGHIQPTAQSALLTKNCIEPINQYKHIDHGGDGTVPRPSAHPPEWANDTSAIFCAQKHGSLQNTNSVLEQLFGVLTDKLGSWMGGAQISVQAPEIVTDGEPFSIIATSKDQDESLALQVIMEEEDGTRAGSTILMTNEGQGRYSAKVSDLPPACYRIIVESATPLRPVDRVANIVLVWDSKIRLNKHP